MSLKDWKKILPKKRNVTMSSGVALYTFVSKTGKSRVFSLHPRLMKKYGLQSGDRIVVVQNHTLPSRFVIYRCNKDEEGWVVGGKGGSRGSVRFPLIPAIEHLQLPGSVVWGFDSIHPIKDDERAGIMFDFGDGVAKRS